MGNSRAKKRNNAIINKRNEFFRIAREELRKTANAEGRPLEAYRHTNLQMLRDAARQVIKGTDIVG